MIYDLNKNNNNIILFCLSISFANSDFQTFGRLAQCGANQSFSDQGHEGNEIGRFENTAENGVNRLIDYQRHRGYEKGQFEMKAKDERQFSAGDLGKKKTLATCN